jgi:hypothetical protein
MKRIALATGVFLITLCMVGCPMNSTQQQQAANASLQAATVFKTAQAGEITAFQNGLIPAADHQFIELQFGNVAQIGKTVDSCIAAASAQAGVFTCLNAAITNLDTMNTNGGLELKSTQAKTDYALAMTSIRTVFASIEATMGGTPPAAPAPAN